MHTLSGGRTYDQSNEREVASILQLQRGRALFETTPVSKRTLM